MPTYVVPKPYQCTVVGCEDVAVQGHVCVVHEVRL